MRTILIVGIALMACAGATTISRAANVEFSGERKLNTLVSVLLEFSGSANSEGPFTFLRARDGWVFVSARCQGKGRVRILLQSATTVTPIIVNDSGESKVVECMRFVRKGEYGLHVDCTGDVVVDKLVVKAIPELVHCGLGFNSSIKAYGAYDMEFLKKDVLPNVTTLIVPHNLQLPPEAIDQWHRQGKRFVGEVGINAQAKTADEHFTFWTEFLDKAPFLDGIIVNEFIVNNPSVPEGAEISPRLQERRDREQARHLVFEEAFRKLHADERYKSKTLYAYVGGSGKKLNQEMIGKTFVRTLLDCDGRIALERYIFEVSSEQKSRDALRMFVEGIADWEAREPGVVQKMVIAFGLFSMPPGGINKQPNVDYHVWMDQQMHAAANSPVFEGLGGLEWWTTILADEETTRFVGRLYRHYAIEGKTEMLTKDPLFLPHLINADFEKGVEGWTLHAAEEGSIAPRSFPRYGRIEGRYMGLGRPADPEHIGDTFLTMKRSEKGANSFSQEIKQLTPGRLYSLKMFSCDYQDLVSPQEKQVEQASPFVGRVVLAGVEVDAKRSFREMYASNPEPKIPVWITYHWIVFRAQGTTAKLTVSDWSDADKAEGPFGLEQTFNFLELQPYHE